VFLLMCDRRGGGQGEYFQSLFSSFLAGGGGTRSSFNFHWQTTVE
jgi:hypothetical protein